MRNRRWPSFVAIILAAAHCGTTSTARAQAGPLADPWNRREELVAAYDQMPDTALRQFFLRCDGEASRRMLDLVEGVHCALAWDTLLRRDYGGNVDKLLEWWRTQRDVVDRRRDDAGGRRLE